MPFVDIEDFHGCSQVEHPKDRVLMWVLTNQFQSNTYDMAMHHQRHYLPL
jgi:hypothetical protein